MCTLRQVSHGFPSESQPTPFRFNRNGVGSTETVSVQPKECRFNRSEVGSTETVSVQPKWCRFNRNGFGSTEAVSVEPKQFRLNRNVFGCESAESGSQPPATAARPRPNHPGLAHSGDGDAAPQARAPPRSPRTLRTSGIIGPRCPVIRYIATLEHLVGLRTRNSTSVTTVPLPQYHSSPRPFI